MAQGSVCSGGKGQTSLLHLIPQVPALQVSGLLSLLPRTLGEGWALVASSVGADFQVLQFGHMTQPSLAMRHIKGLSLSVPQCLQGQSRDANQDCPSVAGRWSVLWGLCTYSLCAWRVCNKCWIGLHSYAVSS